MSKTAAASQYLVTMPPYGLLTKDVPGLADQIKGISLRSSDAGIFASNV
jgi:hypothetical protein